VLSIGEVQSGGISSELLISTLVADKKRMEAIKGELILRVREVDWEARKVFERCLQNVLGERVRCMPYPHYRAGVDFDGFIKVVSNLCPLHITEDEVIRIQNDAVEALSLVYLLPKEMICIRVFGRSPESEGGLARVDMLPLYGWPGDSKSSC